MSHDTSSHTFLQGAVLVYDISGRNTFTNILSCREHGSPMIKIALVGHKTDLEDERQVSKEEGQKVRRLCVCGGGGGGGGGDGERGGWGRV